MTKRIFVMLLLLALAVGLYALNVKADAVTVRPTATGIPSSVPTVTPRALTCEVKTGFDGGTVNLRACGGTSCEVIKILTEGESLNIVTAGLWSRVETKDGVRGWLNSEYCKGGE